MSTFPLVDGSRQTHDAASGERTTIEAVPSRGARTARNRRLIGVGVVVFVVLLQAATQYLSGLDAARIRGHLCFLAVELPTIMVALGLVSTQLKRRHASAGTAVGITVLVAGTLGAGFGVLLHVLSQDFPTVMLRPVANFTLARGALYGFSFGQFHMGLWSLAFAYPFAIDEARVKDLEANQLRSAAELARLRAHLEPHFLLNTLNAIAGLVTEDPREARRLIGCLGDLLRDALHDDDELQTLDAQVGWLQRYAAILQARHAGVLAFEWDVAADTRGILVPRLLLQPLIENAVKHGALQRPGGGTVTLHVHWVGDVLECVVEDDGPGAPPGEPRPGAFGLRAVVRRVELKYPGACVRLEARGERTWDARPRRHSPRRARVGRRESASQPPEPPVSAPEDSPLRTLVVEDEWPARNYLVELLQASRLAEVVGAVSSAEQAREAIEAQSSGVGIECVFVDVQLLGQGGHETGLDLVRSLAYGTRAPMFVLATAFDQHALEAFELGVVDYLLKPFTEDRVTQTLRRLHERRPAPTVPPEGPHLAARIVARKKRSLVFLELHEIWAFETQDRLTSVHTAHGTFDLDLSLAAIEASFGRTFVRVHRQWLVNASHIKELERDGDETRLFVGPALGDDKKGVRVPVARERAAAVRNALLSNATGLRRG